MHTIHYTEVPYTVEDDGSGGSMPVYVHEDERGCPMADKDETYTYVPEVDGPETPVAWAVDFLRGEGLTEDAGRWWADPDRGNNTDEYWRHGVERDRHAFLHGFSDAEEDAIGACMSLIPPGMAPAGSHLVWAAEPLWWEDFGACMWFAACDRPADHLEPHPVLGLVPTCARCADIGK